MKPSGVDFADVQEISLTNGTCIWWGRINAGRQPLRLFRGHESPVVLHFTLAGTATIQIDRLTQSTDVCANQHNLFCVGRAECWLAVPPEKSCEFIQIHVGPEFFTQLSEQTSPTLQHLARLVKTRQPQGLASANLPMTPALHTVLAQLIKCPLTCSLKRLFLEAKILELLALQLSQYEQYLTASVIPMRPPDYDKIAQARHLLEAHFDNPPTLAELSRLVGLNELNSRKVLKK